MTVDALADVRKLIGPAPEGGHRRELLIEHLHALNDAFGGLYKAHLVALAREMGIPMADVYRVATFYRQFEILAEDQPAAGITVRVCAGLTCELAGARRLLSGLPGLIDGVKVTASACLGRCDYAPAAMVGQAAVPRATPEEVVNAVMHERGRASGWGGSAPAPVCIDYDEYRSDGGYALAAAVIGGQEDPEFVVQAMDDSGLCVRSADLPAGAAWRRVRQNARDQAVSALLAIDINDGEPGSFKDRHYLERDPHRFLEGALVAAHVVGADAIYIYLRGDYHECRLMLEGELAALMADPPCRLPHIELRRGAGAFLCGGPRAMLASLEGERAIARDDAGPVEQKGLFGRPTLVHDFETLYGVRDILRKGPKWFAEFGRNGRRGLRSFSVSGRVAAPGVKLAPAGITLRELVEEHCGGMAEGETLYGFLPGGASGGILPAALADVALDDAALQPHGGRIGSAAVVVLGHRDRARDAALDMMRLLAQAGCGQCASCRAATAHAAVLMEAPAWDAAAFAKVSDALAHDGRCGLGQAALRLPRCVHRYFPHEVA